MVNSLLKASPPPAQTNGENEADGENSAKTLREFDGRHVMLFFFHARETLNASRSPLTRSVKSGRGGGLHRVVSFIDHPMPLRLSFLVYAQKTEKEENDRTWFVVSRSCFYCFRSKNYVFFFTLHTTIGIIILRKQS